MAVPQSFHYNIKQQGIPSQADEMKYEEEDKNTFNCWKNQVKGGEAEKVIFDFLREKYDGEAAILVHGFSEGDLLKIVGEHHKHSLSDIQKQEKSSKISQEVRDKENFLSDI